MATNSGFPVQFIKVSSLSKYLELTSKDVNALYFIEDVGRLYKGETLFSGAIKVVSNVSSIGNDAIVDTLYYTKNDGKILKYNGKSYDTLFLPFETSVSNSDEKVPTSKAVQTYVTSITDSLDGRLDTLEGDANTYGSVDFKIKAAVDTINTTTGTLSTDLATVGTRVSTIEGNIGEGPVDGRISAAVSAEATLRDNADKAISGMIGEGFDSSNTIASKISTIESSVSGNTETLTTLTSGAEVDGSIDNKIEAAKTAVKSDINGIIGKGFTKSNTVRTEIDAINELLGGTSSTGGSLSKRVELAETAIGAPSSIIDTNGAILVEMNTSGEVQEGTGIWKLNPEYNPGINLAFNNKIIEYGATKITFAGTVTTTKLDNGEVKVQIGENMNSSSWNTTDGKTTGTVGQISTSDALLNGNTVKVTNTASNTFTSTGSVHFDEGDNLWQIVVTANGENIVEAQLTDTLVCADDGTPTWTATAITYTKQPMNGETALTPITSSITSRQREANYPSAVGGMAKRSFTVDLSKLGDVASKPIVIKISGCGGTFISNKFYYVTGVTPAVASATLTEASSTSVYYSGVKYLNSLSMNFTTGEISNLNNQVELTSSSEKLSFSSSNCSKPTAVKGGSYNDGLTGAAKEQSNTATSFAADVSANSGIQASSFSVTITPNNYHGNGTGVTATYNSPTPVNTCGSDSSATVEGCKAENWRVKNASITANNVDYTDSDIKFNSQNALASDELQLIPGTGIKYPTNATSDATGTIRYFTRRFVKSGSLTGSTITFTFGSGNLSNVKVEILKGENQWVSINKYDGSSFKYATASSTNTKLVLSFGDSNAENGYYFRVGMAKGSTAVITKIEMA